MLRNLLGAFLMAILFFTVSCDKQIEEMEERIDRAENSDLVLQKYETLGFKADVSTGSTTSSAGSGTFTGNGNNIVFYPPGQHSDDIRPEGDANKGITDPLIKGNEFIVNSSYLFTTGGGTIHTELGDSVGLGDETIELTFSNALITDSVGFLNSVAKNLNTFIGISGDFGDLEDYQQRNEIYSIGNPINFIVYVFQYNNVSEIKDLIHTQIVRGSGSSLVVLVKFTEDTDTGEKVAEYYTSIAGDVTFIDKINVILDEVELVQFNMKNKTIVEGPPVFISGTLHHEESTKDYN